MGVKLYYIFLRIEFLEKELWVICCKSAVAIFCYLKYFQNGSLVIIIVKKILENFAKIEIIVNVKLIEENLYNLKKTIFYEGLLLGGEQKSVALLVGDLV